MGPVRVGNEAYEQVQHDASGQIVPSNVQAFFDQRLLRVAGTADLEANELLGDRERKSYAQPDDGRCELRTTQYVYTYSAAMYWAACDRLEQHAATLGLVDGAAFGTDRDT